MKFSIYCLFACLTIPICYLPLKSQTTVNIPISKDNTIYKHEPERSNGSGPLLLVGTDSGSNPKRGLIYFDIAGALPADASITSAELRLDLDRYAATEDGGGPNPVEIGIYRLNNDWGEGISISGTEGNQRNGNGATATENDATWDMRFYKTSSPGTSPMWNKTGGDFESTPSSTLSLGQDLGIKVWTGLANDVQDMLENPSNNHGWILIGNESAGATVRKFDTKEGETAPQLLVTFVGSFPVVLSNFEGMINDQQQVELQWQTESEKDHDFFAIEKSAEGIHFEELGSVGSAGNSEVLRSYSFLDRLPNFGRNYYRLRIVDLDGSFEYSPVIEVEYLENTPAFSSIYPNPLLWNEPLYLELTEAGIDKSAHIVVHDLLGKKMMDFDEPITEGKNRIAVQTSSILPGIYILSYQSSSLEFRKKIIVN